MTAKKQEKKNSLEPRPPVVVILGHVDHGKSSILESIKDLKITAKESGGITQHIGAYQIEHNDNKITFLDTPGHEAFSAMRSRGSKVADIAVLVIAAEEGIKPQTKEAIKHIKKANLSAIIAINKIDKKEAQPEKVKQELSQHGLVAESLGGDIPAVYTSATTNYGIEDLLEMINLVSEMNEFKYDPREKTSGVIIESHTDKFRGATATLLVKEGVLSKDNIIGTDSTCGKIKTMEDFQVNDLDQAPASMPVVVTGFNEAPYVGEKFYVFETQEEAQARIKRKQAKREQEDDKEVMVFEEDQKVLNIILKADVQGSLEAIKESLKSIPNEEVGLRFLKSDIGDIGEADIKLAESANAKILGFKVKANAAVKQMAKNKGVKVYTYQIIYELIQAVREEMSKLLEPEIIKNTFGKVKILEVFKVDKDKQIIGGKVQSGKIKRSSKIDVLREKEKIGEGKLTQLQRDKKEAEEVNQGHECGILFKGNVQIQKGDVLESYEEQKRRRSI